MRFPFKKILFSLIILTQLLFVTAVFLGGLTLWVEGSVQEFLHENSLRSLSKKMDGKTLEFVSDTEETNRVIKIRYFHFDKSYRIDGHYSVNKEYRGDWYIGIGKEPKIILTLEDQDGFMLQEIVLDAQDAVLLGDYVESEDVDRIDKSKYTFGVFSYSINEVVNNIDIQAFARAEAFRIKGSRMFELKEFKTNPSSGPISWKPPEIRRLSPSEEFEKKVQEENARVKKAVVGMTESEVRNACGSCRVVGSEFTSPFRTWWRYGDYKVYWEGKLVESIEKDPLPREETRRKAIEETRRMEKMDQDMNALEELRKAEVVQTWEAQKTEILKDLDDRGVKLGLSWTDALRILGPPISEQAEMTGSFMKYQNFEVYVKNGVVSIIIVPKPVLR